jgi:hypothetical protein
VAEAFEKVTGKKAVAKDVTQDEWFEAAKSYVDPDAKQPSNIPVAPEGDDTRFTFRQSFGAWWNIWSKLFSVQFFLFNSFHAWKYRGTPTGCRSYQKSARACKRDLPGSI